ncbi:MULTISPECIES: DUF2514 domain-containing protein [Achromobacter]|uniref:DUF2514 domain-containing protein n=1 Tax=Alcaligenes xylosoxydans xylosoxydans TaxID=85698 RepID=A0A424W4Z5_ALCXX|nr:MULTISPECIES: DUF2514 domain-containing protein [Achromobacter]MBC9908509.1 DUF2514 domain-containing protein [Achromobacter xylosoxidans]MBD0872464.1 DUF2514 domain-containing protein [Achromobacter xylosoxidans]QNP87665.1 DUF2514 domain-containing protein [Achromobacter xylosoxidans]RPJ88261.1 DUF2514 domain-containing protein [Achromobacter xylosoxidans]
MSIGTALIGGRGYAAAALLGGAAAWFVLGAFHGRELAQLRAVQAIELDAQSQATVAAVEAARTEERRRTAAMEQARDFAQKQAAEAAADAVGARTERDRLRSHANALARAAADRDPTLADGSPSGADAVDLLAYMLGRVSERAAEVAGIADRARIAGLTCERIYDALRQ